MVDQEPRIDGNPLVFRGAGEENLLRDARMDTDTDGDGVVDGWEIDRQTSSPTFSLDGTEDAQKIEVSNGTGPTINAGRISQSILRVFPGDEVMFSFAGKDDGGGEVRVLLLTQWFRAENNSISFSATSLSATSFTRLTKTETAPDEAAYVRMMVGLETIQDSATGIVWCRDARLLRASSDPATYANPHVDGASQTGASLDTAGWPASTLVIRRGDFFVVGGSGKTRSGADSISRYFQAASDVSSDGNGDATIPLMIPILPGASPPDGAALRLRDQSRHSG